MQLCFEEVVVGKEAVEVEEMLRTVITEACQELHKL